MSAETACDRRGGRRRPATRPACGHAAAGAAQARRIGPSVDLCERGADGRGGARADAGRARHPAPGRRRGRSGWRCSTRIACWPGGSSTATPRGRSTGAFCCAGSNGRLRLRERLFDEPYYRLVHAEADGLPGLVVDRFGAVLVVQSNAAGIARLEPLVLDALAALLQPQAIVLRNDSPARAQEGLPREARVALGAFERAEPGPRKRRPVSDRSARRAEDRLVFRPARQSRALSPGWRGGRASSTFIAAPAGLRCRRRAPAPAEVLGIDRSEPALALAAAAAALNEVDGILSFRRAEILGEAARLAAAGERFDLVDRRPPGLRQIAQGGAGGTARLSQARPARRHR